jgi:hypothetical protein
MATTVPTISGVTVGVSTAFVGGTAAFVVGVAGVGTDVAVRATVGVWDSWEVGDVGSPLQLANNNEHCGENGFPLH